KPKAKRSVNEVTLIVGAAVCDGSGHRLEIRTPDWSSVSEVILSANAAHSRPRVLIEQRYRLELDLSFIVMRNFAYETSRALFGEQRKLINPLKGDGLLENCR